MDGRKIIRDPRTVRLATLGCGLLIMSIIVAANLGGIKWAASQIPPELKHYRLPGDDKLAHFVLAGVLSFLFNLSLGLREWRIGRVAIGQGSVILIVLAIMEESSQLWLTHRSFELADLAANIAGILVFGWAAARWHERRRETPRRDEENAEPAQENVN